MARVKLSEFEAKRLLFPTQPVFAASTRTTSGQITKNLGQVPLVVKVDQGIKKRGLQGLVAVNVTAVAAISQIRKWSDQGFSRFLVEPAIAHSTQSERYLSLARTREGWLALFSQTGGIDIEKNWDSVRSVDPQPYRSLTKLMDRYHLSTLEINPFIEQDQTMLALDAAAELDDAALGLAELIPLGLEPVSDRVDSAAETEITLLDQSTPASLKFRLLNPKGRIWMLLSGGGASLVLADEVADLGLGQDLANYGEYSGAPTDDDTYSYSKLILREMLSESVTQSRALVIAGGVANFTDVAKTFRGLIRALEEVKDRLVQAKVKVFVRRGGPNEKQGLAQMKAFLRQSNLLGSVHGHEGPLTGVIAEVVEYLQ